MMRKALMPNRQDTWIRRPQHDLDAVPDISSLWTPGGEPCDPCGDCKRGGAITDCTHCRSATTLYGFQFPNVAALVSGAGDTTVVDYSVEWATDCLWESDDLPVNCSGIDQYGFDLQISGRNPGDVALSFSRRAGANCEAVEFTYRNFFPLKCLCPMLMFLDPESLVGIEAEDLPCSVCVQPTYQNCQYVSFNTCECPNNWTLNIDAAAIATNSGPISSGNSLDTNYCWWWTTQPTGGLYTFVTGTTVINISPASRSVSLHVEQYASIGSLTFIAWAGVWRSPFFGLTPINRWFVTLSGTQLCPDGCWHGETLNRALGSGPLTITVEHLDG